MVITSTITFQPLLAHPELLKILVNFVMHHVQLAYTLMKPKENLLLEEHVPLVLQDLFNLRILTT
jgi:hypothetical protein